MTQHNAMAKVPPHVVANRTADLVNTLDLQTLGEVFARSGYFDDARQASQAIVKILYGRELGVAPVTAMMGIYIINGKPSISAGLMAQRIKSSGRYRYVVKRLDPNACELEIFENDQAVGVSTFTLEDARRAGVLEGRNKHTWTAYGRNMLFARAISNACRWYCPDLFAGSPVYTPEELDAAVDDEGNVVEAPAYVPTQEQAPEEDRDLVRSAEERIWKRWLELLDQAQGLGLNPPPLRLPVERDELKTRGSELVEAISERQAQLDREEAARITGEAHAADERREEGLL